MWLVLSFCFELLQSDNCRITVITLSYLFQIQRNDSTYLCKINNIKNLNNNEFKYN